jgi:hypothetical protein
MCPLCFVQIQGNQIPKTTLHHATAKGERLTLDISYPNYASFGGSKYWLLTQDKLGNLWSIFFKTK